MQPHPAVDPDRVATYVRWSTEEQSEGTTLAVQVEACRQFIQSQGWRWRDDLLFVDDGYSGGTLQRPALTALRAAVRAGRVRCVVVFKLDRLSRSVVDTANLVLAEWGGVCHVRSTREAIDTADPAGRMFFYLLASYAEWERSVIRERTLAGRIQRARSGRVVHVRPYGYRSGPAPGSCEVDPAEAAVVRQVFRAYREGAGFDHIAAQLNAVGIRPRHARRWHGQTVRQMLQNPLYAGTVAFGRTAAGPGRRRTRLEAPRHALVRGAVPPIVTPAEWAAVQRMQQERRPRRGRRPRTGEYLLSGLARCGCGAALVGDRRERGGRSLRYYRCTRRGAAQPGGGPCALIPAGPVETAVLARLAAALAPYLRATIRTTLRRQRDRFRREVEADLAGLASALNGLWARRRRLDADYDRGTLGAENYNRRLNDLRAAEEDLCRRQAAARKRLAQLTAAPCPNLGSPGTRRTAPPPPVAAQDPPLVAVQGLPPVAAQDPPPVAPLRHREFLRLVLAGVRIHRDPAPRGPRAIHIDLTIRHPEG